MDRTDFSPAWNIARKEFGSKISFYVPTIKRYETDEYKNKSYPFFVPVSVTGERCHLNCKHCRGIILKSMYYADSPEQLYELGTKLKARGCRGLLVSGGSKIDGRVPLTKFTTVMAKLKKKLDFKIAVHTGLVDEELAARLAEAKIDSAMIDIIGSNETIKEIYHLNTSVNNYESSLEQLTKYGVKVSPHVVIGLHYGRILGEEKALDIISRYDIASLVLVVLNPLCNTPMEKVQPPEPDEIKNIFIKARKMFPKVPILLGCARPGGKHKLMTDRYALQAGLNGIAYPAEGMVKYARELGLKPSFSEYCCSLIFESEELT